jgi:hypothetical protein
VGKVIAVVDQHIPRPEELGVCEPNPERLRVSEQHLRRQPVALSRRAVRLQVLEWQGLASLAPVPAAGIVDAPNAAARRLVVGDRPEELEARSTPRARKAVGADGVGHREQDEHAGPEALGHDAERPRRWKEERLLLK